MIAIVGANGGIGKAIVRLLGKRYLTAGLDREGTLRSSGCSYFLKLSLGSPSSFATAVRFLEAKAHALKGIVFAQGVYSRRRLHDYDDELLREVFSANFGITFHLTRLLLPQIVKNGGGRIVAISSQAAAGGATDAGYAASKGAANAFIKSVAREYGPSGIRCNAVSPGPVDTPMAKVMGAARTKYYRKAIPIGRFVEPSEVAALVAYLFTDAADGINGAIFDIDGGLVRR